MRHAADPVILLQADMAANAAMCIAAMCALAVLHYIGQCVHAYTEKNAARTLGVVDE